MRSVKSTKLSEEGEVVYHIEVPAKTKTGWKRVPDTSFSSHERAHAYGLKYHTDRTGSKMFRVGNRKKSEISEEPTNVVGSGAIAGFSPLLFLIRRKQKRKENARTNIVKRTTRT